MIDGMNFELSQFGILTDTMALAAVALLGYLVGHRTRNHNHPPRGEDVADEMDRAVQIAKNLQEVTDRIRQELARHQSSISRFQNRVDKMDGRQADDAWHALTEEAEALLGPTMILSTNLSAAYDQLRQHSAELRNFTGSRTDPETGIGNRRSLDEHLASALVGYGLTQSRFSLAMFRVTGSDELEANEEAKVELRRKFASLTEHTARGTDFVARYSEDEVAVLMSHTTLAGATVFSERLMRLVEVNLDCVICGGLAEVREGDNEEKLFSRVDSALYSARSSGTNALYQHNGQTLRRLNGGGNIHNVGTSPEWQAEPAAETANA